MNDSDGAVHGDAATAAADDDNDDDDGDDAKDDDNDDGDDDVEQTHGISSCRRKLAAIFIVSQRTLGLPVAPDMVIIMMMMMMSRTMRIWMIMLTMIFIC